MEQSDKVGRKEMTLDWICLRCGEVHSDMWFAKPKCKRCKWTRPEKPLRELGEN